MRGAWPASKPLPKRTEAKIDLSNLKVIGAKPYIEARGKVEILLKSQARDASRLKSNVFFGVQIDTTKIWVLHQKSRVHCALYHDNSYTSPSMSWPSSPTQPPCPQWQTLQMHGSRLDKTPKCDDANGNANDIHNVISICTYLTHTAAIYATVLFALENAGERDGYRSGTGFRRGW